MYLKCSQPNQLTANKYRRGGLVGYDAALTQLRSGVRFPSTVDEAFYQCQQRTYCTFCFEDLRSYLLIRFDDSFIHVFCYCCDC